VIIAVSRQPILVSVVLILVIFATPLRADEAGPTLSVTVMQPLPRPLTNNALASVTAADRRFIVSFNGLGEGRTRRDTSSGTVVFDDDTDQWSKAVPVPGGVGRLAATAAAVGGLAYVFGGYSVAEDGAEESTPWVYSFDPVKGEYTELSPMPVLVDDTVSVVYDNRFIYLISGWHDLGNVNLVQRYDTVADEWVQATPIPGQAVFGHAGGIVGNRLVYCDGVAVRSFADRSRDFVMSDKCFLGIIDLDDGRRIDWRHLPPHPGLPRYRMAAAGIAEHNAVLFIGGSENPYNYDGTGYNGEPSEPAAGALLYDFNSFGWRHLDYAGRASMDHRALVRWQDRWVTVGGMLGGQQVTDRVAAYLLQQ